VTIDGKSAPMVLVILLAWDLDAQQGFFKLPMKSSVAQATTKMMALTTNKAIPWLLIPSPVCGVSLTLFNSRLLRF